MKHLRKFNESQNKELEEFTDYMNSVFVDLIDEGADVKCSLDEDDGKFDCVVEVPLKLKNALVLDNIVYKRVDIAKQIQAKYGCIRKC